MADIILTGVISGKFLANSLENANVGLPFK